MARPHSALIDLAAGHPLPPMEELDELFLRSAYEHKLHGLLWSRIAGGETIGDSNWQSRLVAWNLWDEARHKRFWHVLEAVVADLNGIGVDVASFKGVTAEARWYGSIGERPCHDLDLLLDPGAFGRADEVLQLLSPGHQLVGHLSKLVNQGDLQELEVLVDGVNVDLHFDLLKLGYPARQSQRIWDACRPHVFVTHHPVRTPTPEIALAQRLLALNRDRFPHLLGYVDVARIAQDIALEWQIFDDFVRREGIEVPAYCTLQAVADTLQLERLPDSRGTSSWRRRIWNIAWRPSIRLLGADALNLYTRRGYLLLPALVRGRLRDTVRSWRRRFFPPRRLFDYLHPETSGPFLWRLMTIRFTSIFGGAPAPRWRQSQ